MYWKGFNLIFIGICEKLIVLQLPGWETSVGVQAEIAEARRLGKPVEYMDWE